MNGHKGAVTTLRFNKLGSSLASGSKDNDIILWDVVGEAGLFCLRGHRDQVLLLEPIFCDAMHCVFGTAFLHVHDLLFSFCSLILRILYCRLRTLYS